MVTRRSPPMFRVPTSAFRVMVFAHGRSILEGNGCQVHSPKVHTQASCLVRARRARPAVAQDARSVPCRRVGIHAPTDTGRPGVGVLSKVLEAVPHAREAGPREAQGSPRSLGRPRLLRQSFEPPRACKTSRTTARRHATSNTARAREAPWCGAVYGRRDSVFLVREGGPRSRYQRCPRHPASISRATGNGQRATGVAAGFDAGTEGWEEGLEIQSGADGAGSADLCGEEAQMRGMPGATPLQDGETTG